MTNSVMQYNFSAITKVPDTVCSNIMVRQSGKATSSGITSVTTMAVKNGQAGILIWIAKDSPEFISSCQIYGNTVVNCYGQAVSFEAGAYPEFNFRNNIFVITGHSVHLLTETIPEQLLPIIKHGQPTGKYRLFFLKTNKPC